jgi:two-component system, response regulator YesN
MMEKKVVLLVDDNVSLRAMIRTAIERDYDVLEASGCKDALRQLAKNVDLALVDYAMPDCDGFDVLKMIRDTHAKLPVILMTGYGSENVAIKAIRTEVTDYIKKPIQMVYLKKRLSELLASKENKGNHEKTEDSKFDDISAYIEERYMDEITLDKLSVMAAMNRFTFCRAFKKRFGQSCISYLNSIRINHATEFLKNHKLKVAEIAQIVGYNNVVHFERVFRTLIGVSPREYRKQLTNLLP